PGDGEKNDSAEYGETVHHHEPGEDDQLVRRTCANGVAGLDPLEKGEPARQQERSRPNGSEHPTVGLPLDFDEQNSGGPESQQQLGEDGDPGDLWCDHGQSPSATNTSPSRPGSGTWKSVDASIWSRTASVDGAILSRRMLG